MITNERQLLKARQALEQFRASLLALRAGSLDATDLHPLIKAAQVEAVEGQLRSLEGEIRDYEELRSGAVSSFELDSLAELPLALIRARIASGLTQKALADRLGVREQQIQRYEASNYEGASFDRLVEISDALGLKVRKRIELMGLAAPAAFAQRLRSIGFTDAFISRRVAPDLDVQADAPAVAERLADIFGWAPDVVLGSGAVDPGSLGGATARFKMPKGREGRSASIYTAYAYRLASLCAKAMADRPRQLPPTDWRACRSSIKERYGDVEFRSALSFAWDLGVVVLPLNDPGAFHGACWRVGGVNVVVLKQAARYPARWLFDLLHELRHAAEQPDATEFEVVEGDEISDERRLSREERQASWFAGQVSLDGQAEDLIKAALDMAGGDLRRLKAALTEVSESRGFDVGAMANYAAFRLSLQGQSWWGPATNLQDKSYDPLAHARDVFFERFAFENLTAGELNLLTLALHDEIEDG